MNLNKTETTMMKRYCTGIVLIVSMVVFTMPGFSQNYPKREMRAVWIATVANIDLAFKNGTFS